MHMILNTKIKNSYAVFKYLARLRRFERPTLFLGGRCSIQTELQAQIMVGAGRIELPTSWSRTKRTTNCAMPRL